MKLNLVPFILGLIFLTLPGFGQNPEVKIPGFNDKYSNYVQQLEQGNTKIDYRDFRESFLESNQFALKGPLYDSLRGQVYLTMQGSDYKEIIRITKAMLSIDYTSLFAHKILQQTYKIIGDTLNRMKYHDIEMGLLLSITKSGDGKSCATGWHVTQIEEEYFILNIIEVDLQMQSLMSSQKNSCDKMDVKTPEGKEETYFFEINKVLEMENKMFGK
jgi:hypothetical protein